LDGLKAGSEDGIYFEDDFLGSQNLVTAEGWVITATTSGTLSLVAKEGGWLKVDSAGHNAENDGVISAQLLNCRVKPLAGRVIVGEARIFLAGITHRFFVGLAATDTSILPSGAIDDASDKVGFYRAKTTTAAKLAVINARTTVEEVTADVATIAETTSIRLGFRVDGLDSVTYFADGVEVAKHTTAARVPNAEMCLTLAATCEGTAVDAELNVDWVRIAQFGGRSAA
jgi:hypothetical protein